MKNDGINAALQFDFDNGLHIHPEDFEGEDQDMLLHCLGEYYVVSINDSICQDLKYYFHEHPAKNQKGLRTMLARKHFGPGENIIHIQKKYVNSADSLVTVDFARVPIWRPEE